MSDRNTILRRRRRRRGGALLELVLTVPISVALIFLSIDVGRLVLVKSYLHDSAAVAARAAARSGDLGTTRGPLSGDTICASSGRDGSNAYRAFCEAASSIPGGSVSGFSVQLTDASGRPAPNDQYCQEGFLYVRVTASGRVEYLTDIFSNTAGVFGITFPGLGDIDIQAHAVARCEVAY